MKNAITLDPGTPPHVARLVALGEAAEMQGQRERARTHYDSALHAMGGSGHSRLAGSIIRWIGRTYRADGNFSAAIDCAEAALAIATLDDDLSGAAHVLNLLGNIHQEIGELEEALRLYDEAHRNAEAAGDRGLLAMIRLHQGIIANIRGNFETARTQYLDSLQGFRAVGREVYVPSVLNNLGMLYTDLRRWEEAEQCYAEAVEACGKLGDQSVRISIEVNRCELSIARGDFANAQSRCDAAFELVQRTGDARSLGELHKHYGVLHRELGALWRSEDHLTRAARIAEERKDLLLAAETAREQADLYWRQQRNQDTLRALNRAYRWFTQLRARQDLADIGGRMADLEKMFLEIVHRWSESIESADPYTQGHCHRVADYACSLAERVIERNGLEGFERENPEGLNGQTLLWFRMGALLHDVGKIEVPISILNKPGALTPAERAIMERHPDAGVALLADIEFPWDIRPMVRHHHERWCAGGYPTGIGGEEIPLSARILCIADVFDALTTDRPYRPGHSHDQALAIMTGPMREHFDPAILELWVEICQDLEWPLRKRVEVGPLKIMPVAV